ncbi:MAG: pantoate--beta-alanine ligase [Pseudomonadota bacterium]
MPQALAESASPRVVRTIPELRAAVAGWRTKGYSIGLVPTMGALHAGHLALARQARRDCERVIATIFVNPTQFNRADDLDSYPRDEATDLAHLAEEATDLVFAPEAPEVYPAGYQTKVALSALTQCLCGVSRPGHMDGVATVVAKLFNQSLPDRAYFGEKDYQQLLIVRQMARDLDIPVEVVAVPTVREADGLALSSRNQLIDPAQRPRAGEIYRVLGDLAKRLAAGVPAASALDAGRARLKDAGFDPIDYLELRAADDLALLERAERPARVFAAAWLGSVRLIDNMAVL